MKRCRRLALCTCLVLFWGASAGVAQWPEVHPQSDSLYWWSLSPDVSPGELQEMLADEAGHKLRYQAAVAKKLASPMNEDQLAELNYYVHGALTPELMRISSVFEAFCRRFSEWPNWKEVAPGELQRYGVSDAGIQNIIKVGQAARDERTRLWEELEPLRQEFIEMRAAAAERMDSDALHTALARRDIAALAKASERPESEVRRLGEAWERDPEEVATAGLELLYEDLSENDWNSLLNFLTREVAKNITSIGFKEEQP